MNADLGAGNDSFSSSLNLTNDLDILAGGELHLDVNGGSGNNTYAILGSGAGGPATLNNGLFDIRLKGGPQVDNMNVNLTGGGFAMNGTLRLQADGGAGNDVLAVALDVDASSPAPQLELSLTGGAGNDTVGVTINNAGPNTAASYGSAGMVLLDGGAGSLDHCAASGNGIVHKRNCEL